MNNAKESFITDILWHKLDGVDMDDMNDMNF